MRNSHVAEITTCLVAFFVSMCLHIIPLPVAAQDYSNISIGVYGIEVEAFPRGRARSKTYKVRVASSFPLHYTLNSSRHCYGFGPTLFLSPINGEELFQVLRNSSGAPSDTYEAESDNGRRVVLGYLSPTTGYISNNPYCVEVAFTVSGIDRTAPTASYTVPAYPMTGQIVDLLPQNIGPAGEVLAETNAWALGPRPYHSLPPGLYLNPQTGEITGRFAEADPYNWWRSLVLVTDQAGNTGEISIDFPPVVAPLPPVFSKVFSPATVDPGGISRLTYTIDNAANLIDVGGLAFTDDFLDGLAVAVTPNAETTCGGTFAPVASATALAFTGGLVAARQSCTISVDVVASRVGTLTGTSGDLTSDLPVTTPGVAATLTVNEVPLSVSMAFEPTAIRAGSVSRLTYELRNDMMLVATSVALSDRLPAGVVLAPELNADNRCGGFLSAAAGGGDVSYSGGSLVAGATCTIAVDVTSAAGGIYPNGTESVTSSLGTSIPAEAMLTVDAADAPGFARVFLPDTIDQGGETQIVFTVDNGANAIAKGANAIAKGANAIAMTGMAFDASLPSGVSVADTPGASNSCGGTFSPVAGATTLGFSGGTLAAGATCEIRVSVRAIAAGMLTGPEVALTSSMATATAAEARLTVGAAAAPGFVKAFSPATVDPGGVSRLTYRIDNAANLIDVGGLAFTDDFPDGLAVADTPDATTTCGGTFAPAASATSLAFSDGSVAAGETCTLSVAVQALRAGALTSTSGALTSDLPVVTPGATATPMVNEVPLSVSMSFEPLTIRAGGVSRLTYVLRNGAAVRATSVALSDRLPADVVLAPELNVDNRCGGFLSATPGGRRVSYSRGSLVAGATCMIAVDVISAAVGRYPNDTESVTSSLGISAAASATLTVNEPPLTVSLAFDPPTIVQGGVSTLTFRIDNTDNLVEVGSLAFTFTTNKLFPFGLVVAPTPNIQNDCGGTLTAAGGATVSLSGGAVAAGGACTISIAVRGLAAGTLTSTSGELTSDLPETAPGASAILKVNPAGAPVFSKVFSPATVDPGGVSTLTFTIDNTANLIDVGRLAFDDNFPVGLAVAGTPNGSTTCGGTFAPAAVGDLSRLYRRPRRGRAKL